MGIPRRRSSRHRRTTVVALLAMLATGISVAATSTSEKTIREVVMSLGASAVEPPAPHALAETGLRALARAHPCLERGLLKGRVVLRCGTKTLEANWPPTTERAAAEILVQAYRLAQTVAPSSTRTSNTVEETAHALAASVGDPYTVYVPPHEVARFSSSATALVATTGIWLSPRDPTLIRDLRPGSDAESQGLVRGDRILYIDDAPTTGIPYADLNGRLIGPAGSIVRLVVKRGGEEPKKVLVGRTLLKEATVSSEMLTGEMLYVRVSSFGRGVAEDVRQEIWDNQCRGIILDLRQNDGGLITEGVALLDLFFRAGSIGGVRSRPGRPAEDFVATHAHTDVVQPLVVLVDGGSASASELVTLVLKDRRRATVLGSQTTGKGSVQQTIHLPDGGALKVTSAHYVGARGAKLAIDGIPPHVFLPPPHSRTVLSGGSPDKDPWVLAALDKLNADETIRVAPVSVGPMP